MDAGTAVLGRRERSKLDKRRRIGEAAREAFTEFGYERANMREIAKRAGVATGTLFLYAPDKRNLLLWILSDDLDAVTVTSFATPPPGFAEADIIDQLIHVFDARYRYWSKDPDLSLHALQELIISREFMATPGSHLAEYVARRVHLIDGITGLVRAQQARGALDSNVDPELIARMANAIYNAALRTWLRMTNPVLADGLAELRQLLRVAVDGCRVRA
jgi:AcrR family transcriptional regulator